MRTICILYNSPVYAQISQHLYLSFPVFNHLHLKSNWLLPAAGTLPTCFRRIPWQHDSEWTGRDTPLEQLRKARYQNRKLTLQLHQMCVQVCGQQGKSNLAASGSKDTSHELTSCVCVTWGDFSVTPVVIYTCGNFKTKIKINYGHFFWHADVALKG